MKTEVFYLFFTIDSLSYISSNRIDTIALSLRRPFYITYISIFMPYLFMYPKYSSKILQSNLSFSGSEVDEKFDMQNSAVFITAIIK